MKLHNSTAEIGWYSVMIQASSPSRIVKDSSDTSLREDLRQIFAATHPQFVYTHNSADKHDTHVGVVLAVLQALPATHQGRRKSTAAKVVLDVTGHDEPAAKLNGVFKSQVAGGKRYDLAVAGRRRANATFFESHATDKATAVTLALDLTPLLDGGDVAAFATGLIDQFKADLPRKLTR